MSYGMVAVAGATLIGGMMSSSAQSDAANSAAGAQRDASSAQIGESRRQFDQIQELLNPWVTEGRYNLGKQGELIGRFGYGPQKDAIDAIAQGPEMAAGVQQGENAMVQNASATGGLRGGNLEGALAQFRPQMLAKLVNQRYQQYAGLNSQGQNAAAMVGNAAATSGQQVITALGDAGAATAGGYLAQGQATANMWGNASKSVGQFVGSGGWDRMMSKF